MGQCFSTSVVEFSFITLHCPDQGVWLIWWKLAYTWCLGKKKCYLLYGTH